MKQTLIKNGDILSMNAERQIFDGGDILVEGNTLKAVGKVPAEMISEDAEVVDAAGKIVMPGMINCLYGISKIVEQTDLSLEAIFQQVVDLIPGSWQYPEITYRSVETYRNYIRKKLGITNKKVNLATYLASL